MSNTVLEHVCLSVHHTFVSVCLSVRHTFVRGALLPNSSEMAWNFQTPFYRMGTDSLRMVYVNFHKSICLRDFSGSGEGVVGRGGVVAKLLRDGLEFLNGILQDEYR